MTNSVPAETKVSSRIKKTPSLNSNEKALNHPFIFKEMYAPEEGALNKIPIHRYSESRFSCVCVFFLLKEKILHGILQSNPHVDLFQRLENIVIIHVVSS